MNAYIDISFIFHIILVLFSNRFVKIFTNKTIGKIKLIFLIVTSIIIYFNILLFANFSLYLNTFYYIFIFIVLYRTKFITPLLSYIFSYYSLVSIIRIFTNAVYFYKGVVLIAVPYAFFYILFVPLITLIIELIIKSIKAIRMLKKYRYNVKVMVGDNTYLINAYFDSGNTLKFKNLPVIFLVDELKNKKETYSEMYISGIGKETGEYKKGKILFDNKEKDVYCAYVKKKSFNGCKCLLNVYLLG